MGAPPWLTPNHGRKRRLPYNNAVSPLNPPAPSGSGRAYPAWARGRRRSASAPERLRARSGAAEPAPRGGGDGPGPPPDRAGVAPPLPLALLPPAQRHELDALIRPPDARHRPAHSVP